VSSIMTNRPSSGKASSSIWTRRCGAPVNWVGYRPQFKPYWTPPARIPKPPRLLFRADHAEARLEYRSGSWKLHRVWGVPTRRRPNVTYAPDLAHGGSGRGAGFGSRLRGNLSDASYPLKLPGGFQQTALYSPDRCILGNESTRRGAGPHIRVIPPVLSFC